MTARKALWASLCLFCLLLPLSIAGANIAWGILLGCLFAFHCAGGRISWNARRSAIEKPLWAYLAVAIATAVLGVDPLHSARFLNQDAHKVWIYLLFSIALASEPAPEALGFLALGFSVAALIGIGQSLPGVLVGADWQRAHAFVHPVTFGEQMSVAALGAFCFLLAPREEVSERPWRRSAAWAVLALTTSALVLSSARTALLSAVLAAGAVWLLLPEWRPRALAAIPLALAASAFSVAGRLRWGSSLANEIAAWRQTGILPSQGQLMRLTLWKVAWRMGLEHPWTGVGLSNYRALFPRYFIGTLDAGAKDWGTAHNLFLHHFAERGLVGVAATAWLLGALWPRALVRARGRPDFWSLWAFAASTAFLVMNLTEVALQTEQVWMLVFFIWIAAEARAPRPSPSPIACPGPSSPTPCRAS